jgi:UDP-glucose 4-epimerase
VENFEYTVLVTGGAGYIGTRTIEQLCDENISVICIDRGGWNSTIRRLANTRRVSFINGDYETTGTLARIFLLCRPIHAVIHLAGESSVAQSISSPLSYYKQVADTIRLLKTMKLVGVKKIIFSSSSAVYGRSGKHPISETDPKRPISPYGTIKLMVERILKDCDAAWGLKSICLRYFSVCGENQNDHHLIPTALRAAAQPPHNFKVFGTDLDTFDGTAVRDFVHVDDVARANVLALKALLDGVDSQTYNVGRGFGYSVKDVIKTVKSITKKNLNLTYVAPRDGDPDHIVSNPYTIKWKLGWQPEYDNLHCIVDSTWKHIKPD